jgi:carbon-monoxide dehydrogenase medium subunit
VIWLKDWKYFEPETLKAACRLLDAHKRDAKLVAGGQSLSALIKRGSIKESCLISLSKISGLDSVKYSDRTGLKIGALVTHRQVENSTEIGSNYPVLIEMMKGIADDQIRNVGTIGGNLCDGDPDADPPAVLLSLNASVTAVSSKGKRQIKVDNFFKGPFQTALRQNEILTEVQIPKPPKLSGSAYFKFTIREGDYPLVGAAAFVNLAPSGICKDARLAFASVANVPIRAKRAERKLKGIKLTAEKIKEAAQIASDELEIVGEAMASVDYKKHLIQVLSIHTLEQALARASQ